MKITRPVDEIMVKMRDFFTAGTSYEFKSEEPFRQELYSYAQMQAHGAEVATNHQILTTQQPDKVLTRLNDNEEVIYKVQETLAEAIKEKQALAPASEWFLDNFYLIKEQIEIGKKHLPKGYSKTLPILAKGKSAGYPRVYDIALEIIAHNDGRVDMNNLTAFIEAYQSKTKLTIGELWAIPIMLRMAIIENIRRIASHVAIDRIDKNEAIYWADELIEVAQKNPREIIITTAEIAKSNVLLNSAFVAEFTRRLQGKGQGFAVPLSWMEQRLADTGYTTAELINQENQKQAADQVSMRNSIESIRLLKTTDWKDFVESLSAIEKILRQDVTGTYPLMDFATRDCYRHVVEWMSKKSKTPEHEIAAQVLALSAERAEQNAPQRQHHVGYFLIDEEGRRTLIKKAGVQLPFKDKLKALLRKRRLFAYAGTTLAFAAIVSLLLAIFLFYVTDVLWLSIVTGILSFVITGHFATVLINWLATLIVKPMALPKMDFSKKIPVENSTLIAIPCLINSEDGINELAADLEVRFLSNPEGNLYYGLLTDFTDAPNETMPKDEALLEHAKETIRQLNIKYQIENQPDQFYLFHRPRKWNPREKVWMGKERKRGKLGELNSLLRQTGHDDFLLVEGNVLYLKNIKYVITLDADTELPREAAWKMIATMAHPLNTPVIDKKKKRVVEGYGILQPRTAVNLPKVTSSLFAKMHSNDSGIDPYTQLVSDVYQDVFYEGSFIGKGIYDIDAFEEVLGNTFPENRILSHDLLEGSYVRSGLLTDVQLFEDYPETYWADISRRHRWIRGDWQIATWGLPFAPDGENKLKRNHISQLSKWKIWDNIKRSLVAPATVLLLVLSWVLLPQPILFLAGLSVIWFLMPVLSFFLQIFHKPKEISLFTHIAEAASALKQSIGDVLFNIACLPFEAYINADAIAKSNWRLLISKRKLLQWTPSAATRSKKQKSIFDAYAYMWPSVVIVLIAALLIFYYAPSSLPIAAPVLLLWLVGPGLAWYISKPTSRKAYTATHLQKEFLQIISRKTWAFFEDFATEAENWLPPDNYQEKPIEVTAHRTSPTNIGLSTLVNVSAYDFGYSTLSELVYRTRNIFATLHQMERYKGHFYNWYDTVTLQPLHPKYVSTVDSGNFIANMLVLRQALSEMHAANIINPRLYDGLMDTLLTAKSTSTQKEKLYAALQDAISKYVNAAPVLLSEIKHSTEIFITEIEKIKTREEGEPALYWLNKLEQQIFSANENINLLAPWAQYMPVAGGLQSLSFLDEIYTLQEVYMLPQKLTTMVESLDAKGLSANEENLLQLITDAVNTGSTQALEKLSKIEKLANECSGFANVEYDFLYDSSKHLFHIGYNVSEDVKDRSYYDILASEARLGIFTAIAQGKIPQDSWFALGRLITNSGPMPVLLSWSGSMFEYLMPDLVMPAYDNTLLEKTTKGVVQNQIDYARKKNIPWGISESGYNLVDTSLNYQYQAFGVPGLGLKRGLGEDLVIAPYATMLSLMVQPEAAIDNLMVLSKNGFEGRYGFYEAIDYTASRMPRGETHVIVKSFMAHHQGMSFVAAARFLLGDKMQQRFEKDAQFQSALLLLKERSPKITNFYTQNDTAVDKQVTSHESHIRIIKKPNTVTPEVQLLSNGKYHVALTNSGGGYSRWRNIALSRWREDMTQDNWGIFCYIKDLATDTVWSNTYQPTLVKCKIDETIFSQGHVEYRRVNDGFETKTDIVVSPEDDVEIRKINITNRSNAPKTLEVTSYCEVVMAAQAADEAHPAFSNLFVQTQFNKDANAILCSRRPRSKNETPPWMFSMMRLNGAQQEEISFETDRMKFTGRTQSLVLPKALQTSGPLSNSEGSVLDPIAAIKYKIVLKPRQTATFELVTGIGETKELCDTLVSKYADRYLRNRAFELSWTHSQVLLRQINATEAEAQLFNKIAGHILYSNATHRADPHIIASNFKGQQGLWSYAISGDLPIVLAKVQDSDNVDLIRQLIKAHAYWRLKGLSVDLVIWNEDFGTYRQLLHDTIMGFVTAMGAIVDQPGGVFVRSGDQLSNEDRVLFQTIARLIFYDDQGSLAEQMAKSKTPKPLPPALNTTVKGGKLITSPASSLPDNLIFNNGTGGFTKDGKEYFILTHPQKTSPAPWVNIIANAQFGTMISESGSSYTWAENAHSYRLTPWKNDPVSDKTGEAFYLRDEESGVYWSASPLPCNSGQPYITRHGFGYTVYEHIFNGIQSEMWVFVDVDEAVKLINIKLKNISGIDRKISITGYVEWILGDTATSTKMHVVCEKDIETGVLFARNRYNSAFAERVAFFDADGPEKTFTCDRTEFLGRNGNVADPEVLLREKLSNRAGAALDPCTAIQLKIDLAPDQEKEALYKLGSGKNEQDARRLALQFKNIDSAREAQNKIHDTWNQILGSVYIKTPDEAFNVITNGWLVYQALACRVWGRSGFYQSGGAFGFRDQLQDVLALMHTRPDVSKAQILLAASRQFKEGDVQHWWHPPTGRGVRTTCSDDYLWLPFVTAKYIEATGDIKILDEYASYIEGRTLRPDEESYYDLPVLLNDWESLYNHCKRAINFGLKFGVHGLPLIGSGDWNDGMDKVGEHGKGESVWLGFFLYDVLIKFAAIASSYGDEDFNKKCLAEAEKLKDNINKNAWDGKWYRRAYFDDGTPLGSEKNEECKIDSISQSWSVISGAGTPERKEQAMQSLNTHLIDRENGIIKLLDPAFDKSDLYPGYIKGYVPGVRENGGQYTHAAIWTMMAFAVMKDKEKVWELFSMVNPVNHAHDDAAVQKYKVEPYVMAADVYGVAPHEGRGGWTWYTGSAGWTYQLALEYILGLKRKGNELHFDPCIPDEWPGFEINYRHGNTYYHFIIKNEKNGNSSFTLDGNLMAENFITLHDDGVQHEVIVQL